MRLIPGPKWEVGTWVIDSAESAIHWIVVNSTLDLGARLAKSNSRWHTSRIWVCLSRPVPLNDRGTGFSKVVHFALCTRSH